MHRDAVVLVVDDDPDCLEAVRDALEAEGYRQVVVAANGREALTYLQAQPDNALPGLIVLDLEMPVMDGWQLARALLRHRPLARVPVLLFSAEQDLPLHAAALHAAGYLPKPAELDDLLSSVRRLARPRPG